MGSTWRWFWHRRTSSLCRRAPFLRGVPGAAAPCAPSLYAGGFTQAPLEAVCPRLCDTLVWPVSPDMGSLSHGACGQPPSGPAVPPHPVPAFPSFVWPLLCFPGCHLPLSQFTFCSAPVPLCHRWSLAEDLAVATVPGSSLCSPCATLALSPSCPFCDARQFSCRNLGLASGVGGRTFLYSALRCPGTVPRLLPCAPASWMFLSTVSEHRGFENCPVVGDTVAGLLHCHAPGAAGTVPVPGSSWNLKPWLWLRHSGDLPVPVRAGLF